MKLLLDGVIIFGSVQYAMVRRILLKPLKDKELNLVLT